MKNLINNIKASQAALVTFAEKQISSSVNIINFNPSTNKQENGKRYSELSVLNADLARHTSYLDSVDIFIQKQLYEKYGLDYDSRCILVINYNQDIYDHTVNFVETVKKAVGNLSDEENIRVIGVNSSFDEEIITEYINVELVISRNSIEDVYGLCQAEEIEKRYPNYHVVASYNRTDVKELQKTIQEYFDK